jgi:hypothetical protein
LIAFLSTAVLRSSRYGPSPTFWLVKAIEALSLLISNAAQIIPSPQVMAIVPNVQDEDTRTLIRRLSETVQLQNEALDHLKSAVEKLATKTRI